MLLYQKKWCKAIAFHSSSEWFGHIKRYQVVFFLTHILTHSSCGLLRVVFKFLLCRPNPPAIQINGSQPLKIIKGTKITLPCYATGSPIPQMKWRRNDIQQSLFCTGHSCNWNVNASKNMTYWCEAHDKMRNDTKKVLIGVLGIIAKVYSEPSWTYKIELFAKMFNSWKSLTIFAKNSILDVRLGSEYASLLQFLNVNFEEIIFVLAELHLLARTSDVFRTLSKIYEENFWLKILWILTVKYLAKISVIALNILHKKLSFPLRTSSVNVIKSGVSCGFGYIYWRNT